MSRTSLDSIKISPPGTELHVICEVCGDLMDVERNVKGYGGFAAAMSGNNKDHDRFFCSHQNEKWHAQARNIIRESQKTNSKKLAEMLLEEAKEIVSTREHTKEPRLW